MIKDKKALALFLSLVLVMAAGVANIAGCIISILSLIVDGSGWGMLFSFTVNLAIVAIAYVAIKGASADHLDKVKGQGVYRTASRNRDSTIQH